MARKTEVAGSVVRTWAKSDEGQAFLTAFAAEKDLDVPTVGERGKFSQTLIDAFHKANKSQRYVTNHVRTVKVTGTRVTESGRKVPVSRTVPITELREFAKANGGGERGRISQATMEAFAARPKV